MAVQTQIRLLLQEQSDRDLHCMHGDIVLCLLSVIRQMTETYHIFMSLNIENQSTKRLPDILYASTTVGIYTEIYKSLFGYPIASFRSYSVFRRTAARVKLFTQRCRFGASTEDSLLAAGLIPRGGEGSLP